MNDLVDLCRGILLAPYGYAADAAQDTFNREVRERLATNGPKAARPAITSSSVREGSVPPASRPALTDNRADDYVRDGEEAERTAREIANNGRDVPCPVCHGWGVNVYGYGEHEQEHLCSYCNGSGRGR